MADPKDILGKCMDGSLEEDRMGLANGANSNSRMVGSKTCLMVAVVYGRVDVVAVLLAHSELNINAADSTGKKEGLARSS